jgi:membrane protein DedA with SNARE-associated domain
VSPGRSRGGVTHLDQLALRLIDFVGQQNNPLGWGVLLLSALVEYVFPPFPGDTVTVFGAFLITARGWSFVAVFASVLMGSLAGAWLDFSFGRWLKRRELAADASHPGHKHSRTREQVDKLVDRFKRHGEVYIVLNRFVPGVRAFFFIAAGMAGLRTRWVLLWAGVSAALWNLLLIAVGSSVGANFDELRRFLSTYSRYAWIALGLMVLAVIARSVYRRLTGR